MHLTDRRPREDDDRPSLPPVATGITLGIWIAVMLILALVVVPAAFGSCTGVSYS